MAQNDDTTEARTMWSDTLMEALYLAIERNKDDGKVNEIIKDLRSKGYEKGYLLEKVEKKLGANGANRLKSLMDGGGAPTGGKATGRGRSAARPRAVRSASMARERAAKQEAGLGGLLTGLVDKIMEIFKKK